MPELNFDKAQEQSNPDEVITLHLDNLEQELDDVFGEVDNEEKVQFESQHQEAGSESKENVFLAENPDARKVIEDTIDEEVEFEGVNDKIADNVQMLVDKKIDETHLLRGLTGETLVEAEEAKNKLFSEMNLATLSEDKIDTAAEELYTKIEAAITKIEAKYATTH